MGSLQDIGKAISPRDNGMFDYDHPTGALSTSSAAPISLQGSDTLQGSGVHVVDHGDFVDGIMVDGETEELVRYLSGSFYPIRIGDVLEDTYRIEHKLGYGESSTVWLARDIKKGKDVALKIMVPRNKGEDEYRMQKEVTSTVQDTSNLVTYLTSFSLPGRKDRGIHRVLVFPVRGPNFRDTLLLPLTSHDYKLSMTTRMSAARQLLKALECLHNGGFVS